jgi:hypothetical protein
MRSIHEGQCGVCGHFGEHHKSDVLVSILTSKKADVSGVKRSFRSATNKIPDSCCNFYSLLSCVVVAGRPERSAPKGRSGRACQQQPLLPALGG